jgi:hypothetical protein
MDRDTPQNFSRLNYHVTIVGIHGDLGRLTEVLDRRLGDGVIRFTAGRLLYLAVQEPAKVEFDLYYNRDRLPNTHTTAFRKDLGEITSIMLQTGYTVSTKKIEKMPKEVELPPLVF